MGKSDGESKYWEEEKFEMFKQFFDEGQLLDLENNNLGEGNNVENIELEGIDIVI